MQNKYLGNYLQKIYIFCIYFRSLNPTASIIHIQRGKKSKNYTEDINNINKLFHPVPIKSNPDDINIGNELSGNLNKRDLLVILNKFIEMKEIKSLSMECGLDGILG